MRGRSFQRIPITFELGAIFEKQQRRQWTPNGIPQVIAQEPDTARRSTTLVGACRTRRSTGRVGRSHQAGPRDRARQWLILDSSAGPTTRTASSSPLNSTNKCRRPAAADQLGRPGPLRRRGHSPGRFDEDRGGRARCRAIAKTSTRAHRQEDPFRQAEAATQMIRRSRGARPIVVVLAALPGPSCGTPLMRLLAGPGACVSDTEEAFAEAQRLPCRVVNDCRCVASGSAGGRRLRARLNLASSLRPLHAWKPSGRSRARCSCSRARGDAATPSGTRTTGSSTVPGHKPCWRP